MRTVCGLDVHKDSVFVCIMNGNRKKFEARYGVLTPELEALRQLLLGHAPVQPAHLRPEQGKVYKLAKLDALLQRCNIRISNYLSSTDSRSYKEVVRLLSEGETSPGRLMEALHGRTRAHGEPGGQGDLEIRPDRRGHGDGHRPDRAVPPEGRTP